MSPEDHHRVDEVTAAGPFKTFVLDPLLILPDDGLELLQVNMFLLSEAMRPGNLPGKGPNHLSDCRVA